MTRELFTNEAYKIADITLADFGRKEIEMAQHEMPGLMALRKKYGNSKPKLAEYSVYQYCNSTV